MFLKKSPKTVLLVTLSLVLFSNCKKGEDDPAISLRTRKARVVGDWHISAGNVALTYLKSGAAPFSRNISFGSSQATMTETYQGGIPTIYTGTYLLSLSFKKDGKFDMSETFAGSIVKASGTWNFTDGIGDAKKKEGIVIRLDAVSTGGTDYSLFNKFATELTYEIKELRNKKMAFKTSNELYIRTDGSKTIYASNYTLLQ